MNWGGRRHGELNAPHGTAPDQGLKVEGGGDSKKYFSFFLTLWEFWKYISYLEIIRISLLDFWKNRNLGQQSLFQKSLRIHWNKYSTFLQCRRYQNFHAIVLSCQMSFFAPATMCHVTKTRRRGWLDLRGTRALIGRHTSVASASILRPTFCWFKCSPIRKCSQGLKLYS